MAFNFNEFSGFGQQPEEKENNAALDALGQSLTSTSDKSFMNGATGNNASKNVTGSVGISNPTAPDSGQEDAADAKLLMALL
jgi:hypothetical protein